MVQCRVWRQSGINLDVAVNLPPSSIQDASLPQTITTLLQKADCLAHWLTVEITESAMMDDPARASATLRQLHDLGVRVSVDDFGVGHSSLAYLKDYPIDEVKMDRSFLNGHLVDARSATIVRSIIEMGHGLGMQVVAEGVEDHGTQEVLEGFGCDLAQGFHLGRPVPQKELTDWLLKTARCPSDRGSSSESRTVEVQGEEHHIWNDQQDPNALGS
jgi:EAL domain-containing protein (putative c-di-GMP-specific phosphodiesterase class I)